MAGYGVGNAMFEQLGRGWRICGTALSFLAFGVGGLVLRTVVFPALNLFIWKRTLRIMLAREVIRLTMRGFIGLMRCLGVLHYDIRGLERLNRAGLLILANHPTLIDTVFLMAFVKHANCIVKSKLWNNPFTRGPVQAAAYISNGRGDELVTDCIASLRNGNNLIIFPEGTRTPKSGDMQFKRGAANIAVRGSCNVTPVIIRCTPPTLGKGDKWWQVPSRWVLFTMEVREDIDIQPIVANARSEAIGVRHLTNYLQEYFMKESERHAAA
jgi:1-acyl-sn-glycerol-3-phosphate acyltransferase